MNRVTGIAVSLVMALGLTACDKPEDKDVARTQDSETAPEQVVHSSQARLAVEGTLIYREREALPEDAVIHVQLMDVSLADAPAKVLTELSETTDGRQVPIPFSLSYTGDGLDTRHRYAVRAEIRDAGGTLHWTTMQHYDVPLTSGTPPTSLELLLGKVNSAEERVPAEEVLAE